jgi:hypothetical protein
MRHDPGLAASPPVRRKLKVQGNVYSSSLDRLLWADTLLAKRRPAATPEPTTGTETAFAFEAAASTDRNARSAV